MIDRLHRSTRRERAVVQSKRPNLVTPRSLVAIVNPENGSGSSDFAAPTPPALEPPRYGRKIANRVDLSWRHAGAGKSVRYFVEVRGSTKASAAEIFAGFVDGKRLRVTLPSDEATYVWRVATVKPRTRHYAQSAWGSLEVHAALVAGRPFASNHP